MKLYKTIALTAGLLFLIVILGIKVFAADEPVVKPKKDKEKDTSKETVVAEGGVCRP